MIEYIIGDIFDSPAQVIVNPVNTVGVMGKGLALSFKQRYPEMFEAYRTVCEKHQLAIGKLWIWYAPDHWLLLFPTKENWRNPSRLAYIEKGLDKFVKTYADKGITSIAFPRLGCGNGELDWGEVQPMMEKYLKPLPIDVYIYLGLNDNIAPEHKMPQQTMDWMKSYAKDMSFDSVKDDIAYNSAITPYAFSADGKLKYVQWKDGCLCFTGDESANPLLVKENELFEIWDDIRSKSVFQIPADDAKKASVYATLHSLGYLSEIRMKDNKSSAMVDGYQMKEGSGRVFALKGAR